MTSAERAALLVSLLNANAEESRRKHEAFAALVRALERRLTRLGRKVRKKK